MSRLLQLVFVLGIFTTFVLCSEHKVTLYSRQSINVPAACETNSGCALVAPMLAAKNCTTDQCCTETFVTGLRDCFLCVGITTGTQNYSIPQRTLDQFIASCDAQNHTVPRVTLPGQDNERSSSSFDPATLSPPTGPTSTPTTTSSTQTQSGSASQTSNASRIPGRWDINMKGLSVLVIGALTRAVGVF